MAASTLGVQWQVALWLTLTHTHTNTPQQYIFRTDGKEEVEAEVRK